MDINTADIHDLYQLQDQPVRVEVHKATNGQDVYGNVYTVDPDTRNLVVAQFTEAEKESPSSLTLIPAYSIKSVHKLSKNVQISTVSHGSEDLIEKIDDMLNKTGEVSSQVIEERKQKLIDHMKSTKVPFEEVEGGLKVGAVVIEPPYTKDNLVSENMVAIARIQKLLAVVLV
ncbi:unnamed protein product [Bursaphelenchus okinawaensis]|uniref:AD domain-containing protein n=1 Tax=Bursaphelenchus okinawaensis TaxID=465554 RepID=A0A811KFN2_9BILA|nr:unnamed protein product [Bursaphelenchus okinawaensis]CAG9101272.1 unnamed protein product [Bursaphelenchus okinawaensis]